MNNTFRVGLQGMAATFCSVTPRGVSLHNSCMDKLGKKDPFAVEAGKRLAAVRKIHGLSQEALAEKTGWVKDEAPGPRAYTPSTIGMYEQGSRGVHAAEASRFSEIFPEYHPAYFAGLIDARESAILLAARGPATPPVKAAEPTLKVPKKEIVTPARKRA